MALLQRGPEDIIHGRVNLIKSRRHRQLVNVADALVLVTVPTRHTMPARKDDKTFEEAIRSAFDAIKLRKYRKSAGKLARTEPLPALHGVVSKVCPAQERGFNPQRRRRRSLVLQACAQTHPV